MVELWKHMDYEDKRLAKYIAGFDGPYTVGEWQELANTSAWAIHDFKKCVNSYDGNYKVKQFTCWHQLLCMIFGQLSNRDSLSDLLLCLKTQRNKWIINKK